MKIYEEITSLQEHEPWCGAKYWHKIICENNLDEEFIAYLEEVIPEGITSTGLNDILWFDDEFIIEFLAIHNVNIKEYEVED